MSDDRERRQVSIYLTPEALPILREASIRLEITQNPRGSVSSIVQHLADRISKGDDPYRGRTFEESVFSSLFELAESLATDCSQGEEEVVEILRKSATRSFIDLPGPVLIDVIQDIRRILFWGDDE